MSIVLGSDYITCTDVTLSLWQSSVFLELVCMQLVNTRTSECPRKVLKTPGSECLLYIPYYIMTPFHMMIPFLWQSCSIYASLCVC